LNRHVKRRSGCIECTVARRNQLRHEKTWAIEDAKQQRYHMCAHCLETFSSKDLVFLSSDATRLEKYANPKRIHIARLQQELANGWFLCRPCFSQNLVLQSSYNKPGIS
jgi:hypothetical protein